MSGTITGITPGGGISGGGQQGNVTIELDTTQNVIFGANISRQNDPPDNVSSGQLASTRWVIRNRGNTNGGATVIVGTQLPPGPYVAGRLWWHSGESQLYVDNGTTFVIAVNNPPEGPPGPAGVAGERGPPGNPGASAANGVTVAHVDGWQPGNVQNALAQLYAMVNEQELPVPQGVGSWAFEWSG